MVHLLKDSQDAAAFEQVQRLFIKLTGTLSAVSIGLQQTQLVLNYVLGQIHPDYTVEQLSDIIKSCAPKEASKTEKGESHAE